MDQNNKTAHDSQGLDSEQDQGRKPRGMKAMEEPPFLELCSVFHQPHRMAIMSALCAAEDLLCFMQLRKETALTDGNLSRHLDALQRAGAIRQTKAFVDLRPRTTIHLTKKGIQQFNDYVSSLNRVTKHLSRSVQVNHRAIRWGLNTA